MELVDKNNKLILIRLQFQILILTPIIFFFLLLSNCKFVLEIHIYVCSIDLQTQKKNVRIQVIFF
jgi:hypothetical protein